MEIKRLKITGGWVEGGIGSDYVWLFFRAVEKFWN
jgi:hypothetical protein